MEGMSWRRRAASAAALLLFLAMTALYLLAPRHVYEVAVWAFGVPPFRFPFVDTMLNLLALDCTRQGVDVIAGDPCLLQGWRYNYGPVWLYLADWTSLTQADRWWLGWGLGLAFVVSLAALPVPRGVRGRNAVWASVLAGISPVVVFAVERANFDVALFVAAVAAALLLARAGALRWAGYALIWLMAALKYYPVMILAIALRETPRRFLWVCLASLTVLGLYVAWYGALILRTLQLVPGGRTDVNMFSARNLPVDVGLGVSWLAGETRAGAVLAPVAVALAVGLLGWGCVSGVSRHVRSSAFIGAMGRLDAGIWVCLLISCATMVGCFFSAQNLAYRAIYLLMAVPAFSQWAWAEDDTGMRTTGKRAVWLLVFIMWGDFFHVRLTILLAMFGVPTAIASLPIWLFILLRELAWWWLITLMLAVLARFAWDSPVAGLLLRRSGKQGF